MFKLKFFVFLVPASLVSLPSTVQEQHNVNVPVFSKTAAFRHTSIPAGKEFFKEMGLNNKWYVAFSEDAEAFYKDIKIKNISSILKKYKRQL